MRFAAWLVSVLLLLAVTAGCRHTGPAGEGFAFWFRNDSQSDGIVQFLTDDPPQGFGYSVAAAHTGGSFFGLTLYSGRIRVVTTDCRIMLEKTVTRSRGGAVVVAPGGHATFVDHAPDGGGPPLGISNDAVPETGDCVPKGVEYTPFDP